MAHEHAACICMDDDDDDDDGVKEVEARGAKGGRKREKDRHADSFL